MQPHSADHRSTYLDVLTLDIERKLRKALSSPGQRPDFLQQLFADVALEIDDRAFDKFFNKDEDQIITANDKIDTSLCFYDVLADYYVEAPEKGKCILDLIVQLWSQSFVSHIFALLFHKWLFEVSVENTEALLRYGSALVQGAGNVFWIDIQTNRRRFLSLFTYLLEEVALIPDRSVKISLQARRDLYLLLSRFLFFYDADGSLEIFLKNFPTFPNTFLIGGPADIFVIELTDQLQKLKVEPVLVHYLARMSALRGLTYIRQFYFLLIQCSKLPTESNYRLGNFNLLYHGDLYRSRAENDDKYKTEGMSLQLHFSWRAYVSDKSCTTRGLGYIGSSLSSGSISSPCHKPLLSIAVPLVLAFLLLEFYRDMHQDGCMLLYTSICFQLG